MKKKLILMHFMCAEDWALAHRDDAVLPIDGIVEALKRVYGDGVRFGEKSFTELCAYAATEFEPDLDGVLMRLRAVVDGLFGANTFGKHVVCNVGASDADDNDIAAADERENAEANRLQALALVEAEIDELVGAREFKALAREIKRVAPRLIQNDTRDIFMCRSYLMAVNDGYGLSTYLRLLGELISALGISENTQGVSAVEIKLDAVRESYEPFECAELAVHKVDGSLRIVCVDISEWMNAADNRFFKAFLREAESRAENCITVFRIPFVDKDVQSRIASSLGDLLCVRAVSVPPLSESEIKRCAELEFGRFGFEMSAQAWKYFFTRMTDEKRDGKFYGPKTVKKTVREILYNKELDNATRRRSDYKVRPSDVKPLCSEMHGELSGFEMLDALVGNESVKSRIREIVAAVEASVKGDIKNSPCIHMCFTGNPGTGKTTVARIVGKILNERGILRAGNLFEYSGRDFCGRYIGETAPKTASMCRDAYGSVLFIDEAYALYRGDGNERDFGREALDTLIAEMENHRHDFVVIMAGYTDDMETLMDGNIGLKSRMPYTVEFPNFTREQLYGIFVTMLPESLACEPELLSAARKYFEGIPDSALCAKDFSNARFVRNLYERTYAKAAMRAQLQNAPLKTLTRDDFERASSEHEFANLVKKKPRIGFGV